MSALLRVVELTKHFKTKVGGTLRAVDGVSFELERGETLGLVGESGCGKSTLARTLVRLSSPTGGRVLFDGKDLHELDRAELRKVRPRLQMIFQDPYGSLDPRMSVGASIAEPLVELERSSASARRARVSELMTTVGLDPALADRYPHQFSGGQRQRVGIARALAPGPELIVCDEPISALDVSIQAQIVNLLKSVQRRLGLSYIFISHDLGMVRHLCDRVAVMYLGKLVEVSPTAALFERPRHPYTQALLAAIPRPPAPGAEESPRRVLAGEIPSAAAPPPGCAFHTRCPIVVSRCRQEVPALERRAGNEHQAVACHLVD